MDAKDTNDFAGLTLGIESNTHVASPKRHGAIVMGDNLIGKKVSNHDNNNMNAHIANKTVIFIDLHTKYNIEFPEKL